MPWNKSIILLAVGIIGVTLMVSSVIETGHQVEAKKAKQYKVRIFVYNAHLVGQEVFVTTLVQKANGKVITKAVVDTEDIIAQTDSDVVRIKTLTVKDKAGQHPSQVLACAFIKGSDIRPSCQHISHQNDNQYIVQFNYNTIVGDFEDYSASHKSQTADNSATDSKSKKETSNNDDAKATDNKTKD